MTKPTPAGAALAHVVPCSHPVEIAFRTYSLVLALSLGPALLPFAFTSTSRVTGRQRLSSLLSRECGPTGFAFSIAFAVGGGSYLQNLLAGLEERHATRPEHLSFGGEPYRPKKRLNPSRIISWLKDLVFSLSETQRLFVLNSLTSAVAIILLQTRKRPPRAATMTNIPMTIPIDMPGKRGIPPTLGLTLLLFVRAMDSVVHGLIHDRVFLIHDDVDRKSEGKDISDAVVRTEGQTKMVKQKWVSHFDALVFSACSARIIWCFFYEPERLPLSYVKWISTLADIDPRISSTLRSVRNGTFSYVQGYAASNELAAFSKDLGYPPSWGNPAFVPAYGTQANEVWKKLGVRGRDGLGGIPCELVHGGNGAGNSCLKNVGIRGSKAWLAAIAIYLPVHLLPTVLTRPRDLLHLEKLIHPLLGVLRSATFLSSFVSFMWFGVCTTRTMVLARLFPSISHDYFDGPFGCIYVASLVCGSSIWIEHERRRGEIALYVLPRAIRTCLSDSWLKGGHREVQIVERLVFTFSLATLLTTAVCRPDSLRGLSRWTLSFIMNGFNGQFWRRKRGDTTPSVPEPNREPGNNIALDKENILTRANTILPSPQM